MKKVLEQEAMTDNELAEVVGGSYSELEKDLKLFKRLGYYTKELPNRITANNFDEYRAVAEDIWSGIDVQVAVKSSKLNSYTLPKDGESFKNTRAGAINYMIYLSGRKNVDPKDYI